MTIQIRWVGSEPKTYTAKELAYKFTDQKEKCYEADQRWGPRLVDKAGKRHPHAAANEECLIRFLRSLSPPPPILSPSSLP